jgi:hypothetical protein
MIKKRGAGLISNSAERIRDQLIRDIGARTRIDDTSQDKNAYLAGRRYVAVKGNKRSHFAALSTAMGWYLDYADAIDSRGCGGRDAETRG